MAVQEDIQRQELLEPVVVVADLQILQEDQAHLDRGMLAVLAQLLPAVVVAELVNQALMLLPTVPKEIVEAEAAMVFLTLSADR